MSFTPIRRFEGKAKELPISGSTTLTKYSIAKMSSGYLVAGAANDDEVQYVCLETKTNSGSSGASSALVLPVDETMDFEALTGTTPVQATHVGTSVDFGSAAALDLTATTDKVFFIDSIKSAADKIVVGRFNKPAIA